MPNQYNRFECAVAYQHTLTDGRLYLASPPVVAWYPERGGTTARLPIHGTPVDAATGEDIEAFVALHLEHTDPLLSVVLVWDRARIRGIDMGGGAHRNTQNRPVSPPHRHFYDSAGRFETEQFDWVGAGIKAQEDHCAVFEYFLT